MASVKLILIITFLIIGIVGAQTNGFTAFSIYIDNVSPTYTNYGGLSLIENIDETFYAYCQWDDNVMLHKYTFEWDISGFPENSSLEYFNESWSNITRTFNSADEGKTVYYKFYGEDKMGNWNSTPYRILTIASIKPENTLLEQDNDSPSIGDPVHITSYWTDNFEVDHVQLQTNESGAWADNGSPVDIDLPQGWANFTIDTTGMNTSPYYWRLVGFDEIGNSNTTPVHYFTPQ